jgi:hypothetical protein
VSLLTWLARRGGAGVVLTFWIAYVLTRPLGASLGDLLTQAKDFGGLNLGPSKTSLLFFAVILVLVTREQVVASRHGVAVKGDGPLGGRQRDYLWAAAGVAAVAGVGLVLSNAQSIPTVADSSSVADQGPVADSRPSFGNGTAPSIARQPHPTTRLGNLSAFATIAVDVKNRVANNDLTGAKTRVKDLEVAWDDAEAGLKPRDSAKWHQLDDEIDAVLTSLRAGTPNQSDCSTTIATLVNTLNKFDGV